MHFNHLWTAWSQDSAPEQGIHPFIQVCSILFIEYVIVLIGFDFSCFMFIV